MEIKKVSIIGFGAVGSLYGLKLIKHLGIENVSIIAKGKRKDRYESLGLVINEKKYFLNIVSPEDLEKTDLVIIATKNLQMEEVLVDIENTIKEDTIILSLLNGIDSERMLEEKFPNNTVLYGFALGLCSEHNVNETTYSSEGRVVFGDKSNKKTEEIYAVEELFKQSLVPYKIPRDILHDQWNKFMLNIIYNTVSSICRGGYGIFHSPSLQLLAFHLAEEITIVAKKEGVDLSLEDAKENLNVILSLDPYGKTSMCQDMEASRKTENKYLSGTIVKLAEKHKIDTPYCRSIFLLAEGCEYRNKMLNG